MQRYLEVVLSARQMHELCCYWALYMVRSEAAMFEQWAFTEVGPPLRLPPASSLASWGATLLGPT